MKIKFNLFVSVLMLSLLIISEYACSQDERNLNLFSVSTVEDFKNFYQSGDYYFGGQPSIEALQWLKDENVTMVINLRTEKEMQQQNQLAYNEAQWVEKMGMKYFVLPIDGSKDYNPEKLAEFANILKESNGKVFIHCKGCYRVTQIMMAYLIGYKNIPVNDVLAFGRQMRYSPPLEGLLDKELSMCMDSN